MDTQANNDQAEGQQPTELAATLEESVRQEFTVRALDALDRHLERLGQDQQAEMRGFGEGQKRLLEALSALSMSDDDEQRMLAEEIRNLRAETSRLQDEHSAMERTVREKEELNSSLAERCTSLLDRADRAEQQRDSALEQCRVLQTKVSDAVERLASAEENKTAALSREQTLLMEKAALELRVAKLQESWEQITKSPAPSTI